MLNEKQLKLRRKFIGGSDAGALLGLSPYATPLSVYNSKVLDEDSVGVDRERLLWGSLSEPMIAEEFARRYEMKVEEKDEPIRDINYSYIGGNPDRYIYANGNETHKGVGILEIKTVNSFVFKKWEIPGGGFDIPDYYYAQLQHYLMVSGLDWGYFACLVGNEKMECLYYDKDPAFCEIMKKVEIDFWKDHVLKEIPPAPTVDDDLLKIYLDAKSETPITANEAAYSDYIELKDIRDRMDDLKEQKGMYENRLKLFLGSCDSIRRDGAPLITWKNRANNKFDVKSFKVAHPKLYEKFFNEGKTRVFLVK